MNANSAVNAYTKVGVESSVVAADPHKLILMLYQGALLSIASAKNSMLRKDIPAKGKSISQAISIINDGLRASLDLKVGGDLAKNLADLYEYMGTRLVIANVKNDPAILEEVSGLLLELRGAWESIRQTEQAQRPQPPASPKTSEKTTLVYGRM